MNPYNVHNPFTRVIAVLIVLEIVLHLSGIQVTTTPILDIILILCGVGVGAASVEYERMKPTTVNEVLGRMYQNLVEMLGGGRRW